jgi:hypothetical protein
MERKGGKGCMVGVRVNLLDHDLLLLGIFCCPNMDIYH